MSDTPRTFDQVWAEMEKLGYQYGPDALEQVKFGWSLAVTALGEDLEGEKAELEARLAAAEKDAERDRWLRNLACNSVSVRYNDHACNYCTAKQWIEEFSTGDLFEDVDPEELQRMKEADSIWTIQIYPNTPVGFNVYHGATLDAAIGEAMKDE